MGLFLENDLFNLFYTLLFIGLWGVTFFATSFRAREVRKAVKRGVVAR